MTAYLVLLGAIAAERMVELALSRRNARRAFARGAIELGRGHFRVMQLLHAGLLIGAGMEVVFLHRPFTLGLAGVMGLLLLAAQTLRYWAIATLGDRWNVRVIVTPGDRVVTAGPYRLLRHPNYLAVVIEGFAIPLIHGAWLTAIVFSLFNGVLLWVRIHCEERALTAHTDYRAAFP
ncbi:MAG: hypothetical protein IT384_04180 [Deltaproteobacteria bacterium]|nr:hypothetical protein [Deltaproteobacteria bacterium]